MATERFNIKEHPHRRLNILTGEWIMVSPHRMKRPWQGKTEAITENETPDYDAACYLCPTNKRSEGENNPDYKSAYTFVNDFSALLYNTEKGSSNKNNLLVAESEHGICKVICFSPNHKLTLPLLSNEAIKNVIDTWQQEFNELAALPNIRYVQIFENKGAIMGCSNPHPHGQIWATTAIPLEVQKEDEKQKIHFEKTGRSLLSDYLATELEEQERILIENEHFVALVPYWAVWPFETMIISKRHITNIADFTEEEKNALAEILKLLTVKYDNLFEISFPYSAGMHQAPVNNGKVDYWHWHMHFYPPLLRSATVKKFMVGYEMLANPQRDITAEYAANQLKNLPTKHYAL